MRKWITLPFNANGIYLFIYIFSVVFLSILVHAWSGWGSRPWGTTTVSGDRTADSHTLYKCFRHRPCAKEALGICKDTTAHFCLLFAVAWISPALNQICRYIYSYLQVGMNGNFNSILKYIYGDTNRRPPDRFYLRFQETIIAFRDCGIIYMTCLSKTTRGQQRSHLRYRHIIIVYSLSVLCA